MHGNTWPGTPHEGDRNGADTHEITRWLLAWKQGDLAARDRFIAAMHPELRKLARHYLNHERGNHTLQTTAALINEAMLRLLEPGQVHAGNRKEFLGLVAEVMRHVLVDWARKRGYQKRAGATRQVELEEALDVSAARREELVRLDDALRDLEKFDPYLSRLVELKYFGGFIIEETAACLGVSVATVKRDWVTAQTWLYQQLSVAEDKR